MGVRQLVADAIRRDDPFYQQTVVVHFNYGSQDLRPLFALADQLDATLEKSGVGAYAGHQIATDRSDGYLYMYGPDADALLRTIMPVLKATLFADGAKVKLRYGPPGSSTQESTICV